MMGNQVKKKIGLYLFTCILSFIVFSILIILLQSTYDQKLGMLILLYPLFFLGMVYSIEGYFFCTVFRTNDDVIMKKSSILPYKMYIPVDKIKRIKSTTEAVRSPKGGIQRMPLFYTVRFIIITTKNYKSNYLYISDAEKKKILVQLNNNSSMGAAHPTRLRPQITIALIPVLFRILLLLIGYCLYINWIM